MRNGNGVLANFPLSDSIYAPDVRSIKGETIERFGEAEWRAIVLTNEIHGHLGIYSTIGAKMGLYAKSLLQWDDEPHIVSYAGSRPPVSCFNDGLQISTGATIGHGLISVSEEPEKRIEALFTYGQEELRLKLNESCQMQIAEDIRLGVDRFGHSKDYWLYIRSLAIKYWSEWDRTNIFDIL